VKKHQLLKLREKSTNFRNYACWVTVSWKQIGENKGDCKNKKRRGRKEKKTEGNKKHRPNNSSYKNPHFNL
jgi:hypothetical protein